MPFTPFHLGPASTIGLLFYKYFDFVTLLIASVIVDLEPLIVILFDLNYPLHGFFHSFLGGSILAFILSVLMFKLREPVYEIAMVFRIEQKSNFAKIVFSSFFGVYSHILLDAPLYTDIRPFYPIMANPLYGTISSSDIYFACGMTLLSGLLLYLIKFVLIRK